MGDRLRRIDNIQVRIGIFVFAPAAVVAAALCIYLHFSTWSRALEVAMLTLLIASVSLHGFWRMNRRWLPWLAIACFAFAIAWQIVLPASVLLFNVNNAAFAFGLMIWWYLVVRPTDDPDRRQKAADADSSALGGVEANP